ncbi:hypothetical protein TB2_012947 [Malus domestica]
MREAGFSSTNVKNNLEDSSTSFVFQCYSNSTNSSSSPNASSPNSPPAFATIPRNPETSSPRSKNGHSQQSQTGLRPIAIVGIVAGDIAGIGILTLVFLYIYRLKKKKSTKAEQSDGFERQWLSNDTDIISFLARTQMPSAGLFRFSNGSMLFKSCLGWCPRTVPPSTPPPPPRAPPRRCSGTSDRS